MFTPSPLEVRRFFIDAWQRRQANLPLDGASAVAAEIIARHPEYHELLSAPQSDLDRQYRPEMGETNPFLHLSLHLAIEEQLSIDQPSGIGQHYLRLIRLRGDEHSAQHALLECLGEAIWRSQRDGKPLDGAAYLESVARAAAG